MAVEAVVREWHSDEGWGGIDSPETPGGCWAHFSHLAVAGFAELAARQGVMLEWEKAEQDGYHYRAVRAWPQGKASVEREPENPSAAVGSTVTVFYDGPPRW